MAKRVKRLKMAIESYKAEIEKHFNKIDDDFNEKNEILARYHIKEIDKSLIVALEHKISLLGTNPNYKELIKVYKNRLEVYKKKLGIE
ncbi:hypothetical protein HY212_07285 [Candidatus Pacearchaeota archaeon]|nr:hypothetical protein [Candidatus Pacearchaeota archaeon]